MHTFLKSLKLETVYATLALIAGILFIILSPPGVNDDESTHYIRVQQIANGQIFNDLLPYPPLENDLRSNEERLIGYGPIDENAYDFIQSFKFDEKLGDGFRLPFDQIIPADNRVHSEKIIEVDSGQATPNSPFAYSPLIAGTFISKAFGLSLLNEYMLSKLFELLCCVGLIYLALRLIPRGKWALFAVSILPITVIQFTAYSHDGLTFAISALLFAYVYHLIYKQAEFTATSASVLAALTLCIGGVKMSYIPLALLPALIPILNKSWRTAKGWAAAALPAGASAALCLLISLQVSKANPDIVFAPPYVNPSAQVAGILHNPLFLLRAILRSAVFQETDSPTWWHSRQQLTLFGAFQFDTLLLQPWFMAASIIAVFLAVCLTAAGAGNRFEKLSFQPTNKENRIFKLSKYFITGACLILIYTSLYIAISPPNDDYVWGTQTRYWLPFLPLLIIPQFAKIVLEEKVILYAKYLILIISTTVLFDAVLSVLINAIRFN